MQKRVYGHLPPKTATSQPWQHVCIDLIALNSIKAKDGTILDLMCLTMIDPATSWLNVIELPNVEITFICKGKEITEVITDESSATTLCESLS